MPKECLLQIKILGIVLARVEEGQSGHGAHARARIAIVGSEQPVLFGHVVRLSHAKALIVGFAHVVLGGEDEIFGGVDVKRFGYFGHEVEAALPVGAIRVAKRGQRVDSSNILLLLTVIVIIIVVVVVAVEVLIFILLFVIIVVDEQIVVENNSELKKSRIGFGFYRVEYFECFSIIALLLLHLK